MCVVEPKSMVEKPCLVTATSMLTEELMAFFLCVFMLGRNVLRVPVSALTPSVPSGKRDHVSDVGHAAQVTQQPIKAQAEATMRDAAISS